MKEENVMRNLLLLFLLGAALLSVDPLAAQNSVDVLGGGPQPADAPMPANWSTTSNANPTPRDITTAITANFYYAGPAMTPLVPGTATGLICLVDAATFTGLFAQEAANCQSGGAVAVLIYDGPTAINAPSTIPVFAMAGVDGKFLQNTVGFDVGTKISHFPIRINVAPVPTNPTG